MTDTIDIGHLRDVVRLHEQTRPRSMQKTIGPSEIGTPCARRLAYRMLDVDTSNQDSDPWPAIVGTSVHAWLDEAFAAENERLGYQRWHTSLRVELPGYTSGTIDLYDALTATVIDHKVPGPTSHKRAKTSGPGEQYRVQGHTYAAGLRLQGFDVNHVAIAYWSRGQLKDSFIWSEPYDETIVDTALARLDALRTTTTTLGLAALPLIPTADAYCNYCPYFLPGVSTVEDACPGHTA